MGWKIRRPDRCFATSCMSSVGGARSTGFGDETPLVFLPAPQRRAEARIRSFGRPLDAAARALAGSRRSGCGGRDGDRERITGEGPACRAASGRRGLHAAVGAERTARSAASPREGPARPSAHGAERVSWALHPLGKRRIRDQGVDGHGRARPAGEGADVSAHAAPRGVPPCGHDPPRLAQLAAHARLSRARVVAAPLVGAKRSRHSRRAYGASCVPADGAATSCPGISSRGAARSLQLRSLFQRPPSRTSRLRPEPRPPSG
jgi:hypothetical protein